MFKTVLTPKETDVHLSIPVDYVGKEIEVLLYSKDELSEGSVLKPNDSSRFKGLLTEEEADKFQDYLKRARNEWERDI